MKLAKNAVSLFAQGYNCSQSIVLTFAPQLGLPADFALRIAAPFGGGMGRLGETCGTVTGALMIIGLKFGSLEVADKASKEKVYELVREFVSQFRARNTSCLCRELLGYDIANLEERQRAREQNLPAKPCSQLVEDSAQILMKLLKRS